MATTLPGVEDIYGKRTAPTPSTNVAEVGPTGLEGRASQFIGTAAGEVEQATQYLAKAEREWDTLQAEDAYNQYQAKLVDLAYGQEGWANVQGKDATDPEFRKTWNDKFDQARTQIAESLNPQAQEMFNRRASVARMRSNASLYEHSAKEAIKYQNTVYTSTVKNELADIWRSYGDNEAFAAANARMDGVTRLYASRNGLPKEAADEMVRDLQNKAWRNRFDAAIAADDTTKAKEIRDAATGVLDSDTKLHMDSKLRGVVADQRAGKEVISVWQKFGPKPDANGVYDFNTPLRMFTMEEQIRMSLADDPVARDKAISELRSKAQSFNTQQTELRNGNVNVVEQALYVKGRTLAQIEKTPEWQGLSGVDQANIKKGFSSYQLTQENRALTAENRARIKDERTTPEQWAIYDTLVGLRSRDKDAFAAMTVADMQAKGLKSPELIGRLIGDKNAVIKKDETEAERDTRIQAAISQVKTIMEDAGIQSTPKTEKQKQKKDQFVGAFSRAIEDWRLANNNKQPNLPDLESIASRLVSNMEVPGVIFGTNTVKTYEEMPTRQAQRFIDAQFARQFGRRPNMSNEADRTAVINAYRKGVKENVDWNSNPHAAWEKR